MASKTLETTTEQASCNKLCTTTANKDETSKTSIKATTSSNQIHNHVDIELVLGTVEKEGAKADVIVNSISLQDYNTGAIANALYMAGGEQYQSECAIHLQSLDIEDIGSTNGSYFGCKKVYHIPFLSSNKSITWLKDKLKRCLEKANEESMRSIAIPMIGIGNMGLQADEMIIGIFDVVSDFSQRHKKVISLKTVYLVVLPTLNEHHELIRILLHERTNNLTAWQNQLVATLNSNHLPDKTMIATTSTAITSSRIQDRKEIALVTKSSNSNLVQNSNLSYVLYFTVCCYTNGKPLRVNLYHGNILAATTNAIVDMTVLCDQHQHLETLDGVMEKNSPEHIVETLQYLPNFKPNCSLYQICPYGCLTGVNQLLIYINANDDQSMSLPLPSIEFNQEHIYHILNAIELFLIDHGCDQIRLDCIDLALGSKDRVEEIATWIREEITRSRLTLPWEITFNKTNLRFGLKTIYISKYCNRIDQMRFIVNEYGQTWGSHEITDEDYFIHVDKSRWHQISLEFWCNYNTILVCCNRKKAIRIHGYQCDILKAISAIHNLFASQLKEKLNQDTQEMIAKNVPWYAIIDQSKVQFDSKMNFEIVKNYEIYLQDKTNKVFKMDTGMKSIDYEKMIMTVDGKQYPIGRLISSNNEIAVPPSWNIVGEIKDGYYCTVGVTNQEEKNQISKLLEGTGIQIRKLTRIQNWNLYRRYQIMKKDVERTVRRYQPGTQVERSLFHGTAKTNVESICKGGFDRDYSGKSYGSALGTGTYFAVAATESRQYGDTLLLARVLTGIYVQGAQCNQPNLSIISGSQSERVHSVVNNMNNPSVFVISNDNSAYPEYIIHI
ncbi:uncharacterized protein TRIADDRAFT_61287 [Trichoplax adhaerens]|uniref:Poly [ADP-ribose] polymerase n=1 Tax=Trichoplax adhaerens TaxID=10228 RepID=B3SAK0_TRIAD|nr:hypothetical protein TRIADDRAFT_61287 [Trichoplax adhaerens]EDV20324.1 hypothetical protein TRIADDRAFT_61287 [Trichoplax adhaerens]|eukprot:XP_002117274.1 hypothetical protein TRIADDRAFT_61287 [Trichoplax adhaerens]